MRNDVPRTTRPTERPTLRPRLRLAAWIGIAQAATALLMLTATTGTAEAAPINVTQYAPNHTDPNKVALFSDYENSAPGTIYDSAENMAFVSLLDGLYALPHNQDNYDSVADMVSSAIDISVSPRGDTSNGWSADCGDDNIVDYEHAPFGFDSWSYADTLSDTVLIDKSLLDGNGNGWSMDDPNDYYLEFGETVPDAFTGHTTTGHDISAPANAYSIIPEPGTGVLLGFAALAAAASRRLARRGTGGLVPYECVPVHHGDEPYKR